MIRKSLLLTTALALAAGCGPMGADTAGDGDARPTEVLDIPDARERAQIRKDLITKRLDAVVLPAMRAHDIDMWLTFSREHHVDPILSEIGGGWGGVRNAYIFFDRGEDTPEKIFIGSHSLRDPTISDAYDVHIFYGYTEEGVRPHLRQVIEERDPQRIGINVSPTLPMADGLTWTLRNFLEETLGETYASRMVSAELVIRDFREMHIPEEIPVFADLCAWTVAWEEEAFSDAVITVGETTIADIHWWMRQRTMELGLINEFLPGVRITRNGENLPINSADHVVMPGDILSVDAGVGYLDYRTDIKRTAYVLRPGETEAPESIRNAWEKALEVTDILTSNWKPGAIAHEVWEADDGRRRGVGVPVRSAEDGRQRGGGPEAARSGRLFPFGRELHPRHRGPGRGGLAVRLRGPGAVSPAGRRVVLGRAAHQHPDSGVGRPGAPDPHRGERPGAPRGRRGVLRAAADRAAAHRGEPVGTRSKPASLKRIRPCRENPSHPGEVLAELYLDPLGMLARRLNVPRTHRQG